MTGGANTTYIPPITPYLLPESPFDNVIRQLGARCAWMRSHTCPCIYGGGQTQGKLPFPGSPDPACLKCFGVGTYWDPPTLPFSVGISYMHLSPSPDEPGTIMDSKFGPVQTSEPSITIPFRDPNAPNSPLSAWTYASTNDFFVMVDMLAQYTAILQVGGVTSLPYQQNLQIAPQGAVTTYNPVTHQVEFIPYDVSGGDVAIDTSAYPPGTAYSVAFASAPIYVAWRRAGGLPHIRPFGNGLVNLPRRFRLQALDMWTRQRGNSPSPQASSSAQGASFPYAIMSGQATLS
jgi:hypothetical protein